MKYVTREDCNQINQNIMNEIKNIKKEIGDIKVSLAGLPEKLIEKLDNRYVSQEAFRPIQKIVYGLVGAILLGVVAAVLTLILR